MTFITNRKISTATKEIYNKQHKAYAKSTKLYERFLKAAQTPGFFGIDTSWLKNKDVLDVGCGSTGYITEAMANFQVGSVTHVDLGSSWIEDLRQNLNSRKIAGEFRFIPGSTTRIPLPDNSFDFTMSNGVLMHLKSKRLARKAIKELLRVTKPGGFLYMYVGINQAGIMDRYIAPALRKAYREDSAFKEFIDELDEVSLQSELKEIYSVGVNNDPLITTEKVEDLVKLFNLDSITFFQNALQVPRQQGTQLDLDFISRVLKENRINKFERVNEIYWSRNDFRRFLTPLHLSKNSKIGRLFYGDGHIKIICQKNK